MRVVWDEAKNRANRRKHGVSFEEASVLFTGDDDFLEIFDEAHSDFEDRFIAVGPVDRGIILLSIPSATKTSFASLAPVGLRSARPTSTRTLEAESDDRDP